MRVVEANSSSELLLSRVSALALGVVNEGPASGVLGDGTTENSPLVNAVEGSDPISKMDSVLISGKTTASLLFGCCGSEAFQKPVFWEFLSILQ